MTDACKRSASKLVIGEPIALTCVRTMMPLSLSEGDLSQYDVRLRPPQLRTHAASILKFRVDPRVLL